MTVIVDIRTVGDIWTNAPEIEQQLMTVDSDKSIVLDAHSEGGDLAAMGVFDLVQRLHSGPVAVTRWSNTVGSCPFPRYQCNQLSHFFKYSKLYWTDAKQPLNPQHLFGLFLGRRTVARNCIQYDVLTRWPTQFLLSQMLTRHTDKWIVDTGRDLDSIDQWIPTDQQAQVKLWFQNYHVPSLDNRGVWDQYTVVETSMIESAQGLLTHYDRFAIELVCETNTRGQSFFPTEKTVRPIMAGKPFLAHAPRDFLKNLRGLGFQTFESCWDESYDQLEGAERWHAMRQVIDTINIDMLAQAYAVADHNRKQLKQLIKNL